MFENEGDPSGTGSYCEQDLGFRLRGRAIGHMQALMPTQHLWIGPGCTAILPPTPSLALTFSLSLYPPLFTVYIVLLSFSHLPFYIFSLIFFPFFKIFFYYPRPDAASPVHVYS